MDVLDVLEREGRSEERVRVLLRQLTARFGAVAHAHPTHSSASRS